MGASSKGDRGFLYQHIAEKASHNTTNTMEEQDKEGFIQWLRLATPAFPNNWTLMQLREFYEREFLNKDK